MKGLVGFSWLSSNISLITSGYHEYPWSSQIPFADGEWPRFFEQPSRFFEVFIRVFFCFLEALHFDAYQTAGNGFNVCALKYLFGNMRKLQATRPNVSHFGAGLFNGKTIKIWLEPKNNCFYVVFDSLKLRSTIFSGHKNVKHLVG